MLLSFQTINNELSTKAWDEMTGNCCDKHRCCDCRFLEVDSPFLHKVWNRGCVACSEAQKVFSAFRSYQDSTVLTAVSEHHWCECWNVHEGNSLRSPAFQEYHPLCRDSVKSDMKRTVDFGTHAHKQQTNKQTHTCRHTHRHTSITVSPSKTITELDETSRRTWHALCLYRRKKKNSIRIKHRIREVTSGYLSILL